MLSIARRAGIETDKLEERVATQSEKDDASTAKGDTRLRKKLGLDDASTVSTTPSQAEAILKDVAEKWDEAAAIAQSKRIPLRKKGIARDTTIEQTNFDENRPKVRQPTPFVKKQQHLIVDEDSD